MDRAVFDRICKRLAAGDSLRKAAKAENYTAQGVLWWINSDTDLAEQYARARDVGYKLLADEIIEISDEATNDFIETKDGPKYNAEAVARSKLRVDSRKWMLSKMLPKVYGDKLQLGGDADNPLTVTVQRLTEKAK